MTSSGGSILIVINNKGIAVSTPIESKTAKRRILIQKFKSSHFKPAILLRSSPTRPDYVVQASTTSPRAARCANRPHAGRTVLQRAGRSNPAASYSGRNGFDDQAKPVTKMKRLVPISVKEKLPPSGKWVIAFTPSSRTVAFYEDGCWRDVIHRVILENVIGWLAAPAAEI
jgi:hypothetical protein